MQKAVNNVQTLYKRWQDLLDNPRTVGKDEYNWTTNELRNNVRSIEWDLEDLDETVGIVEANPRKFNIDIAEVNQRKQFIKQTRDGVNVIKEHMNSPAAKAKVENSSREVSDLFSNFSLIRKSPQYLTVYKELPSVLVVSQARFPQLSDGKDTKRCPQD